MDRRKLLGLAAAGSAAVLIPSLAACARVQQAGPATASADAPAAGGDVVATGGDTPEPAAVDPVQAAVEPPVEPVGGAGLFDVDPDQGAVSQDPNVAVTGDISVMPEDWEF